MTRSRKPLPRDFNPPRLCGGKRRYISAAEATTVKEEQETLNDTLILAIYRCQSGCGGWHLTRTISR